MTTVEQIIKKVRELAAASPDNKYHATPESIICMYHAGKCDDGTEGCIVGQACIALGLVNKYDLMFYYLDNGQFYNDSMTVGQLLKNLGIDLYIKDYWLVKVQVAQDKGKSWSDAIKYADACLETHIKLNEV